MRIGCRSVALATALAAVLAYGGTAHAIANSCASGKVKLAGKIQAGLFKCYAKAAGKAYAPTEPLVIVPCLSKLQNKFVLGSQKLDAKENPAVGKEGTICPAGTGDQAAQYARILSDTNATTKLLDAHFPGPFRTAVDESTNIPVAGKGSKCTSAKLKCAGGKAGCINGCYAKAIGKGTGTGADVDTIAMGCRQKCVDKLNACYDGVELKGPPTALAKNPDANVCSAAIGDKTVIGNTVTHDSLFGIGYYTNQAACGTQIDFVGTSTDGILDTGWTGFAHDSTVISDGHVTVNVSNCSNDGPGTAPNCGVCTYDGPVKNASNEIQTYRCSEDTSKHCTSVSDCTGTCDSYFGTFLPLSAGGTSTCIENIFTGGLSGTADYTTGASTGTAAVVSKVFTGGVPLEHPCPRCLGDATANDGVAGGTCNTGARDTKACDANGSSPNSQFGTTSLDCPPDPNTLVATLAIDLTNTTGTKTRTLGAANTNCRNLGFAGQKCQCDSCDDPGTSPCSTNADCGAKFCAGGTNNTLPCTVDANCPSGLCKAGSICGGKRCQGGPNNGSPCSIASECGGANACGVPGSTTQPNACSAGVGDCVADAGTPSPNDRKCASGPFDQYCGPVETFRQCTSNVQCTFVGDTCSVSKLRVCFDNGNLGEAVSSTGTPDPPVAHNSDPKLASLFCISPTTSSAVNSAAGLPGLGRLELQGHAIDNGTF